MRLIDVAVPVPTLDALTYTVPAHAPLPAVGARVLVPLGKRVVTGITLGPADGVRADHAASVDGCKEIVDVVDPEAFVPHEVVRLSAWVAEYYACGIGEAIAATLPPKAWIASERHAVITGLGHARLLTERGARRDVLERLAAGRPLSVGVLGRGSKGAHAAVVTLARDGLVNVTEPLKGRADASRTIRIVRLTPQGFETVSPLLGLGNRQIEAVERLRGAPEGLPTSVLARDGITPQTVSALMRRGLVQIDRVAVERSPVASLPDAGAFINQVPTIEQASALEQLTSLASTRRFQAALLHGVTGSGKTEVYRQLARTVVGWGRRVLILVPEIALTPAAAAAFQRAFGDRVAIQHSGLSDGERYDQWRRIRRGDIDVVVGTRSAVFAPLVNVGLIVVDEEHDGSYKQAESPRYHGRDVAIVRARSAGALVVLGSATPSLESFHNAASGRYQLIRLRRRVLDRPMADVQIVDMREEFATGGPDVILGTDMKQALAETLDRGEQSIVLLNRRGFACAVFCRQCGSTIECPNCSVSLTVHRAVNRARCHYCNYSIVVPKTCAQCAGPYLEQMGYGTERVEAEILAAFPNARVGRVDRDTIRRRGAMNGMLEAFAAGRLDVMVGTQMIAKGHDFPNVTLVGVVNADIGLGMADFRAAERTFQLLTQVAGRAGRGLVRGRAIVQTLYPGHYSIQHACRQDYEAFYRDEMTYRQAMRYPPAVALVNVIVKGRTREAAMDAARALAGSLRGRAHESFRVLGPAPAPLGRLKGEHRAQFFMKGTHRSAMRKALLAAIGARAELKRRTIVDVDPMTVL